MIKENLVWRGDRKFTSNRIQENLVCRSERKLTVLTLILVLRLDKKVTGFRKI